MEAVLLLNADYSPMNVITFERAFSLLLDEKACMVSAYANRVLRSASQVWDFPAIVVLKNYVKPKKHIRFSRKNILVRDAYTCQYCAFRPVKKSGSPDIEKLTIDHIIPRAKANNGWVILPWKGGLRVRLTSWENVVTACGSCNARKADHDLSSVKMKFRSPPRTPSNLDIIAMMMHRYKIPEEWRDYLPEGAKGWSEYWTGELEDC